MSLKNICESMKALLERIRADLDKVDSGNKAASQRVRTGTIKLEKVAKTFRKESVRAEKSGEFKKVSKKSKKPAKAKAKAKAPKKKAAAKKVAPKRKTATKKRVTAKLPKRRRK